MSELKVLDYNHPQNTSVALTIKVKNTKQSKITHSCDFAVIYYPDGEYNQQYIYNNN